MTGRPRVAVLFGGCSEEHDVSVKSAMEVAASIDTQKYEPIYLGITKSGVWKTCERPHPAWDDGTGRRAVISPDRETHGLLVGARDESGAVHLDAVFPVLHGKTGEDGAVQGLLELSGIPYVGCDIPSSAICMDKSLAYVVARNGGIDTPAFSVLDGADTAAPNELPLSTIRSDRPGRRHGPLTWAGTAPMESGMCSAQERKPHPVRPGRCRTSRGHRPTLRPPGPDHAGRRCH